MEAETIPLPPSEVMSEITQKEEDDEFKKIIKSLEELAISEHISLVSGGNLYIDFELS